MMSHIQLHPKAVVVKKKVLFGKVTLAQEDLRCNLKVIVSEPC